MRASTRTNDTATNDAGHRRRSTALPSILAPAIAAALTALVATACGGGGSGGTGGGGSASGTGQIDNPSTWSTAERNSFNNPSGVGYSRPSPNTETGPDPLFPNQWYLQNPTGVDMHARTAWTTTKGKGARVAVLDDGVEVFHNDLAPNVVPGSFDYRNGSRGAGLPLPVSAEDSHGTGVAGIIAMKEGNGIGGIGVAPEVSLVGFNAMQAGFDSDVSDALTRDGNDNWIVNNSWGAADNGRIWPPSQQFADTILKGIQTGRGGKGTIYTFASGNGGCYNMAQISSASDCVWENSNNDPQTNKLGVIAVCATSPSDKYPIYAEEGANILICGPSSGAQGNIATTALRNGYRQDFSGTSAATPMVSGVVALMLAANPALTWRDVQQVLVRSARKNDQTDKNWVSNAVSGQSFNPFYGFGTVDAGAAVALAKTWQSIGGYESLKKCAAPVVTANLPVPDYDGTTARAVSSSMTVSNCPITKIEFIEIRTSITHAQPGDLDIRLESPSGTQSRLATPHLCYSGNTSTTVTCGSYANYVFGSVRHLDEPVVNGANGKWSLTLADAIKNDAGSLGNWSVTFYGR